MSIKRHFYNGQQYDVDLVKQVVVLKATHHQKLLQKQLWGKFGFKKIGGSSIGDVLETDLYKSRFNAFINISWLGMPILDRKYVDAGIAIEPKVLELIARQPAVDTVEHFDAKTYNYDYFAGKDPIIGGLPDGLVHPQKIVLEVKTAGKAKLAQWEKYGVPLAYLKQAQLYTYLMDLQKFAIVATFLEPEDYAKPHQYPIAERKTRTYPYQINRQQVADDIKLVKAWYLKYTKAGVSPRFKLQQNADLVAFLLCKNASEWATLQSKWIKEGKIKDVG